MSNEEILKQCLEQEAKYQFDSISHEDVWCLGHILVELGNAQEKPVAASSGTMQPPYKNKLLFNIVKTMQF